MKRVGTEGEFWVNGVKKGEWQNISKKPRLKAP